MNAVRKVSSQGGHGKRIRLTGQKKRWLGRESNPRHEDFQSSALPTELPSLLRKGRDMWAQFARALASAIRIFQRGCRRRDGPLRQTPDRSVGRVVEPAEMRGLPPDRCEPAGSVARSALRRPGSSSPKTSSSNRIGGCFHTASSRPACAIFQRQGQRALLPFGTVGGGRPTAEPQ